MFVTVNRRIQGKAQMRNRDPVLAYIPDEDEPFEWLVGRVRSSHLYAQQDEKLRMARANSSEEVRLSKQEKKLLDYDEYASTEEVDDDSDEEPPRHSSNKRASSSASCSNRVKRPRSVKGFLWEKCEGSDGEVSY